VTVCHVDAFTDKPFAGNPAAVCLLAGPADERWMQNVAAEMNLSETAFLHPENDGYRLRWFTPVVEVALCGHATLASAHVLWETGRLDSTAPARFHTLSGLLTCTRTGDGIEMNFPARIAEPAEAPAGLADALGVQPQFLGRSAYDFLVEVDSADTLRSMNPDFARLARVPVRGVIVTSRSDRLEFDFLSRFFAPASGVNEDPVTGSAHCTLGPFWQTRFGKTEFVAAQVSARGGVLKVRIAGDRVFLGGRAVTVLRGELL
jgi:PhzF family phenazine biosynthesis protein